MQLYKDTLPFLRKLEKNNNRDWFQEHKAEFDTIWDEMKNFVAVVQAGLSAMDSIESAKTFRIYRDVRFSKDKTPYKCSLGTGFVRATALRRGGYYMHIQPGESFVGGGFWAPNKEDLKRIRDEFAMDDKTVRTLIAEKNFVKHFGALGGDELKSAPRDFDKEHPAIDLIRKKQFVVSRRFTDEEVDSPDFHKEVVKTFEAMRPFFDYMSEVLTTNLNGELIV